VCKIVLWKMREKFRRTKTLVRLRVRGGIARGGVPGSGLRRFEMPMIGCGLPGSRIAAGRGLARISHHTGKLTNGVPLLGTSSAGRSPLPWHCLFQAVAH
jgi:hypothetical protein